MSDDADIGAELAEREAYAWELFDDRRRWMWVQSQIRIDNADVDVRVEVALAESLALEAWCDANVPSGRRRPRVVAQQQPVPATHTGPRPWWGE